MTFQVNKGGFKRRGERGVGGSQKLEAMDKKHFSAVAKVALANPTASSARRASFRRIQPKKGRKRVSK